MDKVSFGQLSWILNKRTPWCCISGFLPFSPEVIANFSLFCGLFAHFLNWCTKNTIINQHISVLVRWNNHWCIFKKNCCPVQNRAPYDSNLKRQISCLPNHVFRKVLVMNGIGLWVIYKYHVETVHRQILYCIYYECSNFDCLLR